jgi:hypothetical protein
MGNSQGAQQSPLAFQPTLLCRSPLLAHTRASRMAMWCCRSCDTPMVRHLMVVHRLVVAM